MKLNNVKADFQVTGWLSEDPRKTRLGQFGRPIIKMIEPNPKTLSYLAGQLYSETENRSVFLLNYYQPKYERVVREGLAEVSKEGFSVDAEHSDTYVGLTKNSGKSWLHVVRGIEYMCKEGHLIAAATNTPMNPEESWYTHGPSLSRILEREKGRAILIPSHPLFKGSLPVNLLLSAIREPSGTNLGIQEGDLRKYSEYWDALEAWSLSMSMEQSAKVSALAGELKKPTVSNSDSTIENAFTSHNLFRFLDFSSPEDLRQSIRDGLSRENDNACVEIRGQPKQGLKDKVFHILGNIIQNRRYF